MTMEYLRGWLEERGIDEVESVIPDMAGTARGKIVPARKFCREEGMRLPETLFSQTVTGEYPADDVLDDSEHDMVLRPDIDTVRRVPWASDPTAQVIHDCYHHDGSPVTVSPRFLLKHVLALYEERGWKPVVAPEVEFFLVQVNTDPDYPLKPPVGRSGRPETVRQSYSIDAVNEFDPLFEQMYDFCEAQGIEIETLIHESGAAQMEVNFLHTDALSAADQVFLFKRTMRETALRNSMYATFMAKPMADEPGSAMHIHKSIADLQTGENIFSNPDGSVSELFLNHVAGLQKYIPAAMPMFAPYVNSYRRIARHNAAPINLHWGYDNRTVGLRVPISGAENRRVENRVIGADVNPYLAIAASLACGYLGMTQRLKPTEALQKSAYDDEVTLPQGLRNALRLLSQSRELRNVLGDLFVDLYVAIKEREHDTFFQVISPWEREFLLLNV